MELSIGTKTGEFRIVKINEEYIMKLSDCKHGIIVVTDLKEIGMIVGIQYNIDLIQCGGFSFKELAERTIPTVQFPKGTRGIHPGNIRIFKG